MTLDTITARMMKRSCDFGERKALMKMPKQATPLKGDGPKEREMLEASDFAALCFIRSAANENVSSSSRYTFASFRDGTDGPIFFQVRKLSQKKRKVAVKAANIKAKFEAPRFNNAPLFSNRYIERAKTVILVSDTRRFHRSTPNRRSFIATTNTLVREQTIFAIARAGQPAIKPVNI